MGISGPTDYKSVSRYSNVTEKLKKVVMLKAWAHRKLNLKLFKTIKMQIIQSIQNRIYEIRGERVMLDFDLAQLYEVETKALNQAVKRNIKRFPEDFMFRLSLP